MHQHAWQQAACAVIHPSEYQSRHESKRNLNRIAVAYSEEQGGNDNRPHRILPSAQKITLHGSTEQQLFHQRSHDDDGNDSQRIIHHSVECRFHCVGKFGKLVQVVGPHTHAHNEDNGCEKYFSGMGEIEFQVGTFHVFGQQHVGGYRYGKYKLRPENNCHVSWVVLVRNLESAAENHISAGHYTENGNLIQKEVDEKFDYSFHGNCLFCYEWVNIVIYFLFSVSRNPFSVS